MSSQSIEAMLQQPFQPDDVKWRVQRSGIHNGNPWVVVQPYITGRAIQTRLDEVFGFGGWEVFQHETMNGDGFICTVKVWNKDLKRWITKQDVAQKTDIESLKGGASGALKRAGVLLGIGRYLYRLKPEYAQCFKCERRKDATNFIRVYEDNKNKKTSNWADADWIPPVLPDWAMPGLDSSKFSQDIKSATLVMGAQQAFMNASNWASSFSRPDLIKKFEQERDETIKALEDEAKSNVNDKFNAVSKWLDMEVKNFNAVPDEGTVHKISEHIRANLVKKCEGQYFDKEVLFKNLKSSVLARINQLNNK